MVRPLGCFMYTFPKLIKLCILDLKSLSNDLLCFVVILWFFLGFLREISAASVKILASSDAAVLICVCLFYLGNGQFLIVMH